jgi:hypothetical protein
MFDSHENLVCLNPTTNYADILYRMKVPGKALFAILTVKLKGA